MIYLMFTGTDI